MPISSLDVKIRCLCGQCQETVGISAPSLPVEASLCLCNACRASSGMLGCSYLDIASDPSFLQHLALYNLSEDEQRWFCTRCGTHLISHQKALKQYRVASGTIEHDQDVVDITTVSNADQTSDGGLKNFLQDVDSAVEETKQNQSDKPHGLNSDLAGLRKSKKEPRLLGKCHCGGVEFFVTAPNLKSRSISSPWPDLLVPYISGNPENKQDIKWWLRCDDTKYLAGLCACRSCRLGAGFPIQSWAFVPKLNIESQDGSPLTFRIGTLQQYSSSTNVYREFCNKCGATVFWHCDERPDLIDVSVGLLHATSGTLANSHWLDWHTDRVSFAEEALDHRLVAALERGMKTWKSNS